MYSESSSETIHVKHEFNMYVWKHKLSFTSNDQERTSSVLKEKYSASISELFLYVQNHKLYFASTNEDRTSSAVLRRNTANGQRYFFSVIVAYLQGYMSCFFSKNVLHIFVSSHPGLFLMAIDSLSVIDESKLYFPVQK